MISILNELRTKNLRCERKGRLSGPFKEAIDIFVGSNPAMFRMEYPGRHVNNIYLDTYDLGCFHDNIDGFGERLKARIRWYGSLWGRAEKPCLEFKYKDGSVGSKLAYALSPFDLSPDLDFEPVAQSVCALGVGEDVRRQLQVMAPALLNRYSRRYYRSANGRFRLTVDSGIEYYNLAESHTLSRVKPMRDTNVVIELKYDPDDDDGAPAIWNEFPVRIDKNSKYINGFFSHRF